MQQSLAEFLLTEVCCMLPLMSQSSSTLFMGRALRTGLDLLHPDHRSKVLEHQEQQRGHHDIHSRERSFQVGQSEVVRNFQEGPRYGC